MNAFDVFMFIVGNFNAIMLVGGVCILYVMCCTIARVPTNTRSGQSGGDDDQSPV